MKVQTDYGSFELVGYESMTVHYPIATKPERGFAYVQNSDDPNDIGAIPMEDIKNWDDLPNRVELTQAMLIQRNNSHDYKELLKKLNL